MIFATIVVGCSRVLGYVTWELQELFTTSGELTAVAVAEKAACDSRRNTECPWVHNVREALTKLIGSREIVYSSTISRDFGLRVRVIGSCVSTSQLRKLPRRNLHFHSPFPLTRQQSEPPLSQFCFQFLNEK